MRVKTVLDFLSTYNSNQVPNLHVFHVITTSISTYIYLTLIISEIVKSSGHLAAIIFVVNKHAWQHFAIGLHVKNVNVSNVG